MPPYEGDLFSDRELSPLVRSDLLDSFESEAPANSLVGGGSGPTIVTLDDAGGLDEDARRVPEAEMEVQAQVAGEAAAASPELAASSTAKKRGRPSLSGSVTPAKFGASRTPRSAKSSAAPKSAGRSTGKRKATEAEPEDGDSEATPAPRRGRPARSTSASTSARLAAKAATKPARGRPKSTTPAAKPAKKAARSRKGATTNGEVPEGEFEVEEILESVIDADTMEHMYRVKWKGYPESESTWEPKKNLKGALDLVHMFDTKKKKEEAAEAAKKAAARRTAASAAAGASTSGRQASSAGSKRAKAVKAVKKAPSRRGRKRGSRA